MKGNFSEFVEQTGWSIYWGEIHQRHSQLVTVYIVEAFAILGLPLAILRAGETLHEINIIVQRKRLFSRLLEILDKLRYIQKCNDRYTRTTVALPTTSSYTIYNDMLREFPSYAAELRLLRLLGPKLADYLAGKADGVDLLFGTKASRDLLQDYYANGPMLKAATNMFVEYISQSLRAAPTDKPIHILEVGGGTGGTTTPLV